MRPFPPAEKLQFLVGAELSNVTLQPFSIDFRFVDNTLIVCEHGIEYTDERGDMHAHAAQHRLGPDPVTVHALIQDRVSDVIADRTRLTLVFESGRRLMILSEIGPYESGHILHQGDYLVF